MSVPAFKDFSKAANDLISRDYYHSSPLAVEIKTKTPNGVSFLVDGKNSAKDSALNGKVEAQYFDKSSGVTLTQGWTTSNILNTKLELKEAFTPGLSAALNTSFVPESSAKTAKVGITYKQPGINGHALVDVLKGPGFTGDFVLGHGPFIGGAEFTYDLASGKIARYSTALGYLQPTYSATVQATNNLSVFTASFYNRVNPITEVGAKAVWDSKTPSSAGVGIEASIKHILDSTAFVKAKLNNQGIAGFSYSQVLRPGVTLGVGLQADTQRLNESAHKVGLSLKFSP